MGKKFNVVTPELYFMARTFIAYYDDMVSFGFGDLLDKLEIESIKHAEAIVKIFEKENFKID